MQSNLIAYIYDIPSEDNYTSKELTDILNGLGYLCDVQLKQSMAMKPFLTAIVKFEC